MMMNVQAVSQAAMRIRKILTKDKALATSCRKTLLILGEKKA